MQIYRHNILPQGEELMHVPFDNCKCKPKVIDKGGVPHLFHQSFDHRELVYAVEIMLGFRCKEHGHYVDRDKPGCAHTGLPDRYYEYPHPKQ